MTLAPFHATGASFSGYSEDNPLDTSEITQRGLIDLVTSGRWRTLSEDFSRVGNCAHPIRLLGASTRIDAGTGEIVAEYSTTQESSGVLLTRCGNRRDSVCPACSRIYARDFYQMLRAGVTGGKTVPETVADNPLVFATFTAPSFGRVHNHATCGKHGIDRSCEHHGYAVCGRKHTADDPLIGQPLCAQCYDYESHVLWQWWAPELWRRFTISLRRTLARSLGIPISRLPDHAVVQYAKVAEYQARGAIHFHALIRVDGPKKRGPYSRALRTITAGRLAECIRHAALSLEVDADHPLDGTIFMMRFGTQLDVRSVNARNRPDYPGAGLTPSQVAGYLVKYATKATGFDVDAPNPHQRRIIRHIRELASHPLPANYALLEKWAHMLGFRGHFGTKSRAWSITLGALRAARARYQRFLADGVDLPINQQDLDQLLLDADADTTLVISDMRYVSSGWETHTEQALAKAAAARAREYDQWIAHQRQSNESDRERREFRNE